MYAQAPFTEAAVLPMLSGMDVLDKGGYIQKFKFRRNILQEFHDNGYETFINHFYPTVYPSCSCVGADFVYYQGYYNFMELWSYRLKYYSFLFLDGELSDTEISMLEDMLCDNFEAYSHVQKCGMGSRSL